MKYDTAMRLLELERELHRRNAIESFPTFLDYISPSYERQWFHTIIAQKCQQLLEGTLGKSRLMLFLPPQHGKALEVTTPVLTANKGWVKHGDLRTGDIVFSPEGKQIRVLATTIHYPCECSNVHFADGYEITAAEQHEWGCFVPDYNHNPVYYPRIETSEINKKKKDRNPYISTSKALEYEEKNLPIQPYLLGLWLGDGSSCNKQICKSIDDCNFFLSQQEGKIVRVRGNVAYFTFTELNCTKLRNVGVLCNKHIPNDYLQASIQQRTDLLCGLMDTDGSCDKRGNCEIVQTKKELAYQICELIRGLGYKPRIIEGDAAINGRIVSKKYRVLFTPNREDRVFRLPRKAERLRNKTTADRGDKYKHFIHTIEPCGEKAVNCIQVEGGYYLVGRELVATHNSEIVSRNFPAWAFGRDPNLKIAGCSYSIDLASQFSRAIQRTLDSEEYRRVFPNTYLNGSNIRTTTRGYLRNVDIFEIVGHSGFYKAVGVGGGLTGTPVDIAIIDDPVKDAVEASSPTYRQRVWEWYNTVLTTRLHNKSKQLFIMTRWHEDDLAGRILSAEPEKWEVISLPAICEVERDGGVSERHIGDALWEERHSLEKLLGQRERAPREFAALYQQHPTIEGGNIVKREWFRTISAKDFNLLHFREPVHFYLDTAYNKKKAGQDNDPSGILAACRIGQNIYLIDAVSVYKEMPDLLRFIPQYIGGHGGNGESVLHVEPKANGISVIQMLKELTTLNVKATPTPKDEKAVRLRVVSPRIECGRVYLVEGSWNEDFLAQVCAFPNAPHDEYVDILGYAINDLIEDDLDIDFENFNPI